MKGITKIIGGLAIGTVNSALGAGGGMIAVPMLRKSGMEQNRAQANAVALIMLLTAASAGIYIYTGKVTFGDALPYLPAGLIGSVLGSFILPKIPTKNTRQDFCPFHALGGSEDADAMKTILAAFFSGLAGSLGLGGGGVLVLYLVLALGMPQLKAQGINLLFFIPCAVLSSIVYSFKKLIDWKSVLLFAAGGLPGVLLGSLAVSHMNSNIPGKIFGGFLLLMGIKELFRKGD